MCFFVQASDLGNLELYQVKLGVSRKQKSTFSKFREPKGVRTVTWTAAYAASPNRLLRLSIVS